MRIRGYVHRESVNRDDLQQLKIQGERGNSLNIQEIKRRLYSLMVSGVHIFIQTMLMTATWKEYYNPYIRIPFWTRGHWYIMTLYMVALMFFTHVYGGLKIGYLKV